ncbi:TonB-dependent receptor [Balneatrix alpica]|uniref:TonB-dependent receptor n=1 Tax=Balneatrix alpica TaxID=75684 RepID=UPI002739B4B5|nr:TonB-dependent siderophore receptor [Balneatrix alpica]
MLNQRLTAVINQPSDCALPSQRTPMVVSSLALAISAITSGMAYAASPQPNDVTLDTLVVVESKLPADANPYAEPGAPYKAKSLSDKRRSRDIADTPQTMTVLTKDLIEDSGKTELKDLLSAQPGITLGTGEGGNSFGDRYIIRGYEARSDVYTDGLREPGLITRETFALDQVEITKGPSSTFAGRGSTGGAVNTVTKKAILDDDFTTLSAGLGSDGYQRYSTDSNQALNDKVAVRANLLYTQADTPSRAPAGEGRQGALLAATIAATDKLTINADYYHFSTDDRTDPGIAYNRTSGSFLKYDYVGQDGLDFQKTGADIFTLGLDYDFGNGVRLENKSRLGNTSNDYIVSVYSSRSSSGLRSFTGWQDNDYLGNQTNLLIDRDIAGRRHTIIAGAEYAKETVKSGNYAITTSNSFVLNPYSAQHNLWQGSTSKNAMASKLELETLSAYLMDTVTLTDKLEVFAGARYDYFDYHLFTTSNSKTYAYDDGFWNGHLGAVFSAWDNGKLYASWSTSSNINGGEADAGTNCGYGGLCSDSAGNYAAAEPEQSTNYEVGVKFNLNDDRLLATAALFQITKDDVIEGGNDSYASGGSLNTGKNRVEGIELGLSGNLTDKLSGQVGVALMNSETLASYNASNIGLPKANFSEKSAHLQLRYQATPKFAFGGNLTYASEIFGGQPDAGATSSVRLPSYRVYDLFATYNFSQDLELRANLQNVTDEEYYTAVYRGGSIVYLGDARSANLTLTYKF